jgi:hypothetical protein
MSQSKDTDYEKAILWVPDPASPKGWIRRKVWSPEEEAAKPRTRPMMGFGGMRRDPEAAD